MKFIQLLFFTILCFATAAAQQVLTFEKELNLIPEGIAIHPANGEIFISSIAQKKIIKILPDGSSVNFIEPGQDNFLEGLGMKADLKSNTLWAVSNIRKGKTFTSQVHGFDLTTGKTRHQFSVTDTIPRLFNDLLVDQNGKLLITDTYYSSIYTYDPKDKKLDILIRDTSKLKWPNGIDFVDNNNLIIATYGKGLLRVNTDTKKIDPLVGYADQSLAYGLDGLALHKNYLYGIYNAGRGGYGTNTVIRYTLDEKRESILSETIVDKGNTSFADPTTAAIYNNNLYVIANSHLDQFNANKETVAGIEQALTPLKLIVYKL